MNPLSWVKVAQALICIALGAAVGALAAQLVSRAEIATLKANHAKDEKAWADERTKAADAHTEALGKVLERNTKLQQQVDNQEIENAKVIAAQAARTASLTRTARVLQDRVAALTAASTPTGAPTCPAAVDLQERATELGVMVTRVDEFAGRAGKAADDYADELRSCRAYVTTVRPAEETVR